jgi:hypothetical protein
MSLGRRDQPPGCSSQRRSTHSSEIANETSLNEIRNEKKNE